MSNTTISVTQAAEAARPADIRRAEAAARTARIERERSAQARNQILAEEERYRRIQERLDAAASRLPDLVVDGSLSWPDAPGEKAGANRLEAYLSGLRRRLDAFEQQVGQAIERAEHILQRRQATAAAWRTSQDAETQWRMNHQARAELSQRLGQTASADALPTRPAKTAELEAVQDHVARLQTAISRQEISLTQMRAEVRKLARAGETVGATIGSVRSGEQALVEHSEAAAAEARSRFEASLALAMSSNDLRFDDLPLGLQRLIEGARRMADEKDWKVSLGDWMAREARRRTDTARALTMLSSPPEGALEDADLAHRWQQLTPRLQAVIAGHESMTGDIEAEFAQLARDAQQSLDARLSRAANFAQLAQQGMSPEECEGGSYIIEIDERTWLELQEYEGESGEYGATLVLKTDAPEGSFDEEAKTAEVCEMLAKAAGQQNTDKVKSDSEVVERKSRITRDRKPALKARAMRF